MTFAHRTRDPGPARVGGFPAGTHVRVHSGQFDGRTGIVVDCTPDLRPGSVWVEFTPGHARLVPGYRLEVDEMSDN
ncbi:KOW motif-containing protein [Amycolatopsis mongoliensis]|uniref:KOW motif-containing protein n=1 Tax=Amycolatopsis mongoliensis TaxID=715475 RepID=A0A9Y2JSP0_9PSEU|nr:KOW motif-containing protein [Amycolatopsis sp. 4-36]WIY02961.1 KOW motif-containing protein [Amycolatopsis sp. 4-36]